MPLVGGRLPRKEGRDKVTGRADYIDDVSFKGLWHGVTVRSQVPRGRIKTIEFLPGVPWDEIVVVRAEDIPGKNHVALIVDDQPVLAHDSINHPEEAILLLAHPSQDVLRKARDCVRIVTEALPALFTIEDALAAQTIIWGTDNVFKSYLINKGAIDNVWAHADHIVEGEYRTGAQEQLYIEPQGMVGQFDAVTGVTVWGSMQCPYYIHKALKVVFALTDDSMVRVIQTETGGGFGGKEEYPSMLAAHAALLARQSNHLVKMIYDRAEDMAATTKRHPSRTRIKSAVRNDGTILGHDIEFVIDGGAYATLSAVVLSRGTIHAPGPYAVANVRVRSCAVATNAPPHGAFRGFGAPQSVFAMERHMDVVAARIGLDPVALRHKNLLTTGGTTATGQIISEPVDLSGMLNRAVADAKYLEKRAQYAVTNKTEKLKRGIGLALFMHGAGFTGSGERALGSIAALEATASGLVRVLSSSTEIGQGTNTVFTQIVADALQIAPERIEVVRPDTRVVPNSGPTVASRTVMVVGKLLETAARTLRDRLIGERGWDGRDGASFVAACAEGLKVVSEYRAPDNIFWDDKLYRGDAYATYAWAAYVADVTIDPDTYEITLNDFLAVQDIGRVVHPLMAEGQVEGGVAQAIGFALSEQVVWKEGRMANNRMTNYIMPTAVDLPPIRVVFMPWPTAHGPAGGAKGLGELPMDGTAPAILNAIAHAIGVPATAIPYMPEDLLRDLQLSGDA